MEEFKEFLSYVVVGFDKMREDNKSDYSKMTAKKLIESIWFIVPIYNKEKAKEKADKILNSLELV